MDEIKANSNIELLDILRKIDITVPCRTQGRTTDHCEQWSICRLLASLAKNGLLEYPIEVYHKDKPDFRLHMPWNIIGIEVTEAIIEDYAQAEAIREKENPGCIVDMSLFNRDTRKKTLSELRNIASQDSLIGPGWKGNDPEKEWAYLISDVTHKKLQKFLSPDFQKFPANWLLIYDNLPFPSLNLDLCLKLLFGSLSLYWCQSEKFDAILIDRSSKIIKVTSNYYKEWEVCNVWTHI
jgi:hypothetical protein